MMLAAIAALVLAAQAPGPEQVSFPTEDGGVVHADLYGRGDRGGVLTCLRAYVLTCLRADVLTC